MTPATAPVIALAADHAGFTLKEYAITHLKKAGFKVIDLGTHSDDRVDYPDFGFALAKSILAGEAPLGIGICGSGIGISIALNRFAGIRAALCHDVTSAHLARQHNDANVLCLGARLVSEDVAIDCIDAFLESAFEGGRHTARVEKLGSCGVK